MIIPHSKEFYKSKLFPIPHFEEYSDGLYKLKESYNTENLYDFYLSVKGGTSDITLCTDESKAEEEYTIDINENGVKICASCDKGFYRGITTLRQMIYGESEISFGHIEDKPSLNCRLWMIDISRCRMSKLEEIKRVVDFVSGLKYNEFSLYMENFCYKYPEFPEYSEGYECLTCDDIMELDAYCKDRFITLVPAINTFGHLRSWLDKPELKHLAIGDGTRSSATINPLLDESLEFIDKLMNSVFPYFSSKKAFIGFDEAMELGTYQTEEICKEKGKVNVVIDWLLKVIKLATEKYGKEMCGVSQDMFVAEPECIDRVPKCTYMTCWGYSQTQTPLIEAQCMLLNSLGIRYCASTSTETYEALTARYEQAFSNIRSNLEFGRKHNAIGAIVHNWGDGGHPQHLVWDYLPTAFGAQMAWNTGLEQEIDAAYFKSEYVHAAERYLDKFVFGAKVSRIIYQLGNYCLLEPERIHGATVCARVLTSPLSQNYYPYFFDMEEIGEDFYFDNIIDYMSKLIVKIDNIDFSERYKREIIVNSKMVVLGAELAKVKLAHCVTQRKADELCRLIDWIIKEQTEVWLMSVYPEGLQTFIGKLKDRRAELLSMVIK